MRWLQSDKTSRCDVAAPMLTCVNIVLLAVVLGVLFIPSLATTASINGPQEIDSKASNMNPWSSRLPEGISPAALHKKGLLDKLPQPLQALANRTAGETDQNNQINDEPKKDKRMIEIEHHISASSTDHPEDIEDDDDAEGTVDSLLSSVETPGNGKKMMANETKASRIRLVRAVETLENVIKKAKRIREAAEQENEEASNRPDSSAKSFMGLGSHVDDQSTDDPTSTSNDITSNDITSNNGSQEIDPKASDMNPSDAAVPEGISPAALRKKELLDKLPQPLQAPANRTAGESEVPASASGTKKQEIVTEEAQNTATKNALMSIIKLVEKLLLKAQKLNEQNRNENSTAPQNPEAFISLAHHQSSSKASPSVLLHVATLRRSSPVLGIHSSNIHSHGKMTKNLTNSLYSSSSSSTPAAPYMPDAKPKILKQISRQSHVYDHLPTRPVTSSFLLLNHKLASHHHLGVGFDLGTLLGSGISKVITGPKSEPGGVGSYFDFTSPDFDDYPYACKCNGAEMDDYKNNRITKVTCRNYVDMSLQNTKAYCDPENAAPGRGLSANTLKLFVLLSVGSIVVAQLI